MSGDNHEQRRYRLCVNSLWLAVATILWICTVSTHAEQALPEGDALLPESLMQPEADTSEQVATARRWFLILAWVNVHPKLETERLIDRYFDPAMKFLAPGYDDVLKISDLRDMCLLWPPHFGIGYVLSPKWVIFLQGGYSVGKVRTKADDRSVLLLPLHTDLEIQRGAAYFGLGLDFYPFGQPETKKREGWRERLRAARPSLGARYTYTYATYDAKVKVGFKPLPNIGIKLSDSWFIPSVNLNLGVDIPIDDKNQLFCNAGYAFFSDQDQDFNGAAFTIGWKHFFR